MLSANFRSEGIFLYLLRFSIDSNVTCMRSYVMPQYCR